MLLLGAGESGKSTIFKQMRLLYGTERSDDDLRMYGVVARSNIVVATRKLCSHLRNLGLEEELDRESRESEELEHNDHSSMNCRQAYDELMAYLVDNTATASAQDPNDSGNGPSSISGNDWVGQSPRAGLAANNDAKQFLEHHESIRILWQVSLLLVWNCVVVVCGLVVVLWCFCGWGMLVLVRGIVCYLIWFGVVKVGIKMDMIKFGY